MASEFQSLFNQVGLPEETEEEILARRSRAIQQKSLDRLDKGIRSSTNPTLFRAGFNLGRVVAPEHARLSPTEQKRAATTEAVRNRIEALAQTDGFRSMDAQQKANEFNRIVAEEAYRNGLPAVATQASTKFFENERARKTSDLEFRKLQASARRAENVQPLLDQLSIAKSLEDIERSDRPVLRQIWLKGDNNPANGMAAAIDPNTLQARVGNNVLDVGEYSITEPPKLNVDPEKMTLSDRRKVTKILTKPSDFSKTRELAQTLNSQFGVMESVFDLIEAMVDRQGAINFFGGAGQIQQSAQRLLNNVGTLSRAAGSSLYVPIETGDGRVISVNKNKLKGANAEDALSSFGVPMDTFIQDAIDAGKLQDTARARAQFSSLMMTLTYAQARAFEPGARQLSDQDIQRAATVVGESLTDPTALRDVFVSNLQRTDGRFKFNLNAYPEVIPRADIINQKVLQELETRRGKFLERAAKFGGTAGQPVVPAPEEDEKGSQQEIDDILAELVN